MRNRRRYFRAVCPRCGYLNCCRLVEGIHPPAETQAEYDCASCGKRSVSRIAAVSHRGGIAATSRWAWVPIVPATVHDPGRLRRTLEATS